MSVTYLIGSVVGFAALARGSAWVFRRGGEMRATISLFLVVLAILAAYGGLIAYVLCQIHDALHWNSYWIGA